MWLVARATNSRLDLLRAEELVRVRLGFGGDEIHRALPSPCPAGRVAMLHHFQIAGQLRVRALLWMNPFKLYRHLLLLDWPSRLQELIRHHSIRWSHSFLNLLDLEHIARSLQLVDEISLRLLDRLPVHMRSRLELVIERAVGLVGVFLWLGAAE